MSPLMSNITNSYVGRSESGSRGGHVARMQLWHAARSAWTPGLLQRVLRMCLMLPLMSNVTNSYVGRSKSSSRGGCVARGVVPAPSPPAPASTPTSMALALSSAIFLCSEGAGGVPPPHLSALATSPGGDEAASTSTSPSHFTTRSADSARCLSDVAPAPPPASEPSPRSPMTPRPPKCREMLNTYVRFRINFNKITIKS